MSNTVSNLTQEQLELSAEATEAAAKQKSGYPSDPGECAQFQRKVTTNVLGLMRSWHPGPDAKAVGQLLRSRGLLVKSGHPEVGDLLVWTGEGHGSHGHIAMRVLGNRIAENATIHHNQTGDARGFRPLAGLDPNFSVYRLWK